MGRPIFQFRPLPGLDMSKRNPATGRVFRINLTLTGPLADFAYKLRTEGYVRNVPDLVCLALRTLQQKVTEEELTRARLETIKMSREESP